MPHEWREDDLWLRDWLREVADDTGAGFVFIKGHRKPLDVSASAGKLLANIENAVPFEVSELIIKACKFYATMIGKNKEQPVTRWTSSPDEDAMLDAAESPLPLPLPWETIQQRRRA